ncbi:MAG TPA: CoA-transferase [Myxococcales bacterium]|nr:CoA-transferase [Myxococcales bacterium]
MNVATKARLAAHVLAWRLTWGRHDIDQLVRGLPRNPKFMSARSAVQLIPDGATVISTGMAGNMRCAILYWAVREEFERTHHPRGLTWIAVGGIGGRGRLPGTLEEVGRDGLVVRHISGHLETAKSLLQLAAAGRCEIHTLPQGVLARLVEAQAQGQEALVTRVGVGSFVDPRTGTGTLVAGRAESLASPEGEALRYAIPPIQAALFAAASADAAGNLYMRNASLLTESREAALAARRHGGKVIATVAEVVEGRPDEIFLPAGEVDAIVVCPRNEQVGSIPQRRYLPMFVPGRPVDVELAEEELEFVNRLVGITPRRSAVDEALAREAASLVTRTVAPGSTLNCGVGLPEEVCRLIHEAGLLGDVTFLLETGVYGGLPAPGVFFGAAIAPERFMSSAEMFRFMEGHLDAALLGFLQVDSEGNVNVSKRGTGPLEYVGPGGFIDVSSAAKTVIFVGSAMTGAHVALEDGELRIFQPGRPKLVPRVDEVTFSGKEALRRGQSVWYVTTLGTFHLTERGLELVSLMRGGDVGRAVQSLPIDLVRGSGPTPLVERAVCTGEGFHLAWQLPRRARAA